MSAEKIIKQIKKDTETQIKLILKEAENTSKEIKQNAKIAVKTEVEKITNKGQIEAENIKKILISKVNQEAKKQIMQEKEKIIDECFLKAHHKLSILKGDKYKRIVRAYVLKGIQKLGKTSTLQISRDIDKQIAKDLGLEVCGKIDACGGVKIVSSNGKVTLDYTFDAILKREKDKIRIKVGKLLFS